MYSNKCSVPTPMPRVFYLFLSIVAAFPPYLSAAPPISEDAPVAAEVAAVARTLGLDPPRDRARFVSEFARLLYTPPPGRTWAVAALLNPRLLDPAMSVEQPMRVPVPLSADVWSRAVFRRPVTSDQLVAAIMADRRAALVCYGLAALDDETLAFLSEHSAILTRLYDHDAPAFAAFGASLRIRANRVRPPGDEGAVPLWEAAVHESATNPDAFVRALFSPNASRIAYLYDTIAQLDAPAAAFALGAWMPDSAARILRFGALVEICGRSYREWRYETLPFSRPLHDLAMLFMRIRTESNGAPVEPASRAFWSAVFAGDDLRADSVAFVNDATPIDAAWLADITTGGDMFWRGERNDQFAFGQRVFAGVSESERSDAVVAIRAFPRQRVLLMTLERMGIRTPAVYASVARQVSRMTGGNPSRAFWMLAQFQSALALVARMTAVGTLAPSESQRLVVSLCGLSIDDDRHAGTLAGWLKRELLPRLPPSDEVESRLIAGMAGPDRGPSAPRVFWEGQQYRLDLAAGERRRLQLIRDRQEGYSVDLAFALESVARMLAAEGLTPDKAREASSRLSALPEAFGKRFDAAPEIRAPGVDQPRPARERIEKINEDLSKIARNTDLKRIARLAPAIDELAGEMLGDALLSLAYAADLGDPEGTAMLARNVALRHDFGFARKDADARARTVWSLPRQDFLPGVPWHVTGSVLGLDVALAPLSLTRISPDRMADVPRLPSQEREAFAITVALMNPRRLLDADRDAIAAAVSRGSLRVATMAAGGEPFEPIADAVGLDGWRRRAIRWMMTNDPASIPSMFSLVEFLTLGGGAEGADLNAWGTTALQSVGCVCTRMASPQSWRLLSGRPQMAFMAAGVPDLNLYVAIVLGEMHLPAALTKSVLGAAALDFIEDVGPSDPNDWWTVARAARSIPRERIEDYVAAAAAVDGPLVPDETESTHQP
jgi:hypothetical protein